MRSRSHGREERPRVIAPPTLDWLAFQRVRFEKDRGVSSVSTRGSFTYLDISLGCLTLPARVFRVVIAGDDRSDTTDALADCRAALAR